MVVIQARGASRWYGEVVGLNDLSVDIGPGITGLLGPNGAGKSTFMKVIVGELRPSNGEILVLGERPFANLRLYRRLGFCPQQDALYESMTGRGFVRHCLRLGGYGRRDADRLARRALERVHLEEAMDRRVRGYSKGMRQRTRLAQSIAHSPELLIVDEPLTGLDPIARHQTLELFQELGQAGTSILASSHILHEIQSLTEQIVVIHRGRLLAQGSVGEVRSLLSRHPRKVSLVVRDARPLASALVGLPHVEGVSISELELGSLITVDTTDMDNLFSELPRIASDVQAGIRALDSADASLEAVFDYLVG